VRLKRKVDYCAESVYRGNIDIPLTVSAWRESKRRPYYYCHIGECGVKIKPQKSEHRISGKIIK
jgi:hypothetical protein